MEDIFQQSQLDTVPNSSEIFSPLQGTELGYDEQLFDALVEVRLARWARLNGYSDIEKLLAKGGKTPEFLMKKDGGVVLAEAKHYTARDSLPSLVGDRLEGLALKTGAQGAIDLWVTTTHKYQRERQSVLSQQSIYWIRTVREELTESWYLSLLQQPSFNPDKPAALLGGLLDLKMKNGNGFVIPSWGGNLNGLKTAELFQEKLKSDFIKKLAQIKEFIDREQIGASQAIVFFSGTGPENMEWDILWDQLEREKDPSHWPWNSIRSMYEEGKTSIPVPFELIVGKGNPLEYGSFPWRPT